MPYAFGKICERHPELKGWRRNSNCPACQGERVKPKRKPKTREEIRTAVSRWREKNPQRYLAAKLARNALRRARKKAATVGELGDGYRRLLARARLHGMTIDHKTPLSGCRVCGAKGTHELSNMWLLTSRANSRKGDRCLDCWAKAKTPPKRGL